MRKLYQPNSIKKNPVVAAKGMAIEHNVTLNVIDPQTGLVVDQHIGHNAATNSLLTGIGHYLIGDGVYNQAYETLSKYLPRYISLGTMGLLSQEEDEFGLPIGLGAMEDFDETTGEFTSDEITRLCHYMVQCPGFGADGYDANENQSREYFGLGPQFHDDRGSTLKEKYFNGKPLYCELISETFPRVEISFRDIVPEAEAEIPKTIDVVYSAMVSVGALSQFRDEDKDYIFITEAGLWSEKNYLEGGENGLLAAYRIVPPSQTNWNMGTYMEGEYDEAGLAIVPPHYELDPNDEELAAKQAENQRLLKTNILKVKRNQVVQVIWKIQLGGLDQLGGMNELYPSMTNDFIWKFWD